MDADKRKSVGQLFKAHYSGRYLYAYQMIRDSETCKDIVEDVFEYLWNNYDKIDPATAKSYLYVSVRTRCIDYLRRQQVHEQYVQFCMLMTEPTSEEGQEDPDDRQLRMREVIRQQTPRTRLILEACYVHGKKYQEVADALEISKSAVRKHIMKVLGALREEFKIMKDKK